MYTRRETVVMRPRAPSCGPRPRKPIQVPESLCRLVLHSTVLCTSAADEHATRLARWFALEEHFGDEVSWYAVGRRLVARWMCGGGRRRRGGHAVHHGGRREGGHRHADHARALRLGRVLGVLQTHDLLATHVRLDALLQIHRQLQHGHGNFCLTREM